MNADENLLTKKHNNYDDIEIYKELIVCSNILIDTKHILSTTDEWHPLVIRKGKKPRVWLSTRINNTPEKIDQNDFQIIQLIVDSEVSHSAVKFINTEFGFQISVNDIIIAEAANHTSDSIEVTSLDLRPLGLNIYGDHTSLTIGNTTMSKNTSKGSNSMFGIN